ncbi:NAD-dependent epimerase/dehydratase family protein [Chitinophaga arvensicola]|uniref:Nucleoside-diphosphate-sugar epimerase n=1 Tax=Chitinophaga arvensicola TaxID=29529 RepID=A0A1I0S8E5_9BACT|nr:NAD-dependent epimerase/dehydratase family protein [Chitinophaga arvensicola]SEW52233.1 Nucleoside-diphosphate-sugar epimerase [Chitinophaga arvensicola]
MQTILGANGQIARELALELKRNYTADIRLVSRHPEKVNETDTLFPADLMDAALTAKAVEGSDIVYLTVGLPMDTARWVAQFPIIMRNVINACKQHRAKLVFFDNTYMYPQDDNPLTESSPFRPVGKKGQVRGAMAEMLLAEIAANSIDAVICRAPEFYGPGNTQSITNSLIFDNIARGKTLKVLLRDDTLRTLIWTPDASRATALIGNTPDAFNQTWHLPCDDNRLTYRQFIAEASRIYGRELKYNIEKKWMLQLGALFNKRLKELQELLPRYAHNNIFDSSGFKQRFPGFKVTTYQQGMAIIKAEQVQKTAASR